ncbi:Agamous-like MADS-box protein AGL75 [Cardamine amara subsp. amara]|uniref:Agamous-like MADS-box protein AGL75 n=1 Tax=Cardamine amara subsp. amara TaxID=228776 RepID=A0ABD1A7C9_CARAN
MMISFPSSSCSNSLSSSYSLASTSLSNRLETIFKKASELSILCEIEICVIYYGPDGELKTWPEEKEKVKDMAFRYSQLHEAVRRKKRVDLYGFLNKKNNKEGKHLNKKKKTSLKNVKYPISDHYSADQISRMIRSLELSYSTLQERLRFVESQKQKNINLDHQASLNHQHHQNQTKSLNPSQFSLFMYNHGEATFSQIPLATSNFNLTAPTQFTNYPQDLSGLLQESGLMNQELHGLDQNMCMSNFNNNNFQHPQQYYTAWS